MEITRRKEKDTMKDYSQTYNKNLFFLLKSVFHNPLRNQFSEYFLSSNKKQLNTIFKPFQKIKTWYHLDHS